MIQNKPIDFTPRHEGMYFVGLFSTALTSNIITGRILKYLPCEKYIKVSVARDMYLTHMDLWKAKIFDVSDTPIICTAIEDFRKDYTRAKEIALKKIRRE